MIEVDWQGWDGTMTTSIARPHPNGFLFVGRYETSGYETLVDMTGEVVARVIVAAEIIRQTSSIFKRIRQ